VKRTVCISVKLARNFHGHEHCKALGWFFFCRFFFVVLFSSICSCMVRVCGRRGIHPCTALALLLSAIVQSVGHAATPTIPMSNFVGAGVCGDKEGVGTAARLRAPGCLSASARGLLICDDHNTKLRLVPIDHTSGQPQRSQTLLKSMGMLYACMHVGMQGCMYVCRCVFV
jgi:hypothetical protein